jgi:hypothetical protein
MAIGWLFVFLPPVAAVQRSQFYISLEDANKRCVCVWCCFHSFVTVLVRASKAMTNRKKNYKTFSATEIYEVCVCWGGACGSLVNLVYINDARQFSILGLPSIGGKLELAG